MTTFNRGDGVRDIIDTLRADSPFYRTAEAEDWTGLQAALVALEADRRAARTPPPYDPLDDLREALAVLRRPDPDVAEAIGLVEGVVEAAEYARERGG